MNSFPEYHIESKNNQPVVTYSFSFTFLIIDVVIEFDGK